MSLNLDVLLLFCDFGARSSYNPSANAWMFARVPHGQIVCIESLFQSEEFREIVDNSRENPEGGLR